jgi:anti-sigma B factor antagonist
MRLERRDTDAAVLLIADGEIDGMTAPRLGTALHNALHDAVEQPIILDLTEVALLSSAGLAVLLDAVGSAERLHTPLRIVVDHNRPVIRPIQITGLEDRLQLYTTTTEALTGRPDAHR